MEDYKVREILENHQYKVGYRKATRMAVDLILKRYGKDGIPLMFELKDNKFCRVTV